MMTVRGFFRWTSTVIVTDLQKNSMRKRPKPNLIWTNRNNKAHGNKHTWRQTKHNTAQHKEKNQREKPERKKRVTKRNNGEKEEVIKNIHNDKKIIYFALLFCEIGLNVRVATCEDYLHVKLYECGPCSYICVYVCLGKVAAYDSFFFHFMYNFPIVRSHRTCKQVQFSPIEFFIRQTNSLNHSAWANTFPGSHNFIYLSIYRIWLKPNLTLKSMWKTTIWLHDDFCSIYHDVPMMQISEQQECCK